MMCLTIHSIITKHKSEDRQQRVDKMGRKIASEYQKIIWEIKE